MELSERKKRILSAVVEEYIATGEPVGSKLLAAGMGISSATIRNEMSELAELGYLEQPHTSAGRVPTPLGYRMYVDQLMGIYHLNPAERNVIEKMLRGSFGDVESTLEKAGNMLAEFTGCATVSTAPAGSADMIRRIEMAPAGRRSLLLVILTTSGVIKSRICRIEDDLTADMLNFFSRLANDRLCGRSVDTVTPDFISGIKNELYEYTYALSPVLDTILEELHSVGTEVFVGGAANILSHRELNPEEAMSILKLLGHRDELLRIIGESQNGVSVRIGSENGMPFMGSSSLIAAPYAFQGKICGTIGIIGPMRINYSKMMSSIEYFSLILSRLINESFGD